MLQHKILISAPEQKQQLGISGTDVLLDRTYIWRRMHLHAVAPSSGCTVLRGDETAEV